MTEREEALVAGYLPMSEQSFLLLLCLTTPHHGYAIMQEAARETAGRVTLGASTVYTILYKLEQDGMIVVTEEVERRKIYEITDLGRQLLRAEQARLENLAAHGAAVLAAGERG